MSMRTTILLIGCAALVAACPASDDGDTTGGDGASSEGGSGTSSADGSASSTTVGTSASTSASTSAGTSASTSAGTSAGTGDESGTSGKADTGDGSAGETKGACCDATDPPVCIEGSTCCADGTWMCNDLGQIPCEQGEICGHGEETGGACQAAQESCANGEACCQGLTCCFGVPVPPGQEYCGAECPDSDRNLKRDFAAVDAAAVLKKVIGMPITTWSYTFEDPSVRHIGPMAQDFKAAFEVGATDKAIFKVDADGVALAAIQALAAELTAAKDERAKLARDLAALERRLDAMEGGR
jgi:hypothetical protein